MNDKDTIRLLKESNKPVLIYGNAARARILQQSLTECDINVSAFVVDKEYWYEGNTINGIPVEAINNVKNIEDYNLVIGFCNVEKTKA